LADALAVRERCASLDPATCLHVALAIDRSETTRDEPVPEGFLALSAAEIDGFVGERPASILYFWRRDCDPCETVKGFLESTLRAFEVPPEVGLGAIYGPDHVRRLREEYDVGAAPTVLFFRGGSVESRFVGNPGEEAIEDEVRLLLEDVDA
ncbi:thioredoxin family protein, partial [Halobium palmae]